MLISERISVEEKKLKIIRVINYLVNNYNVRDQFSDELEKMDNGELDFNDLRKLLINVKRIIDIIKPDINSREYNDFLERKISEVTDNSNEQL